MENLAHHMLGTWLDLELQLTDMHTQSKHTITKF